MFNFSYSYKGPNPYTPIQLFLVPKRNRDL